MGTLDGKYNSGKLMSDVLSMGTIWGMIGILHDFRWPNKCSKSSQIQMVFALQMLLGLLK